MSKPDHNWEDHWRETLAEHKASPPSSTDWAGMEQLLDAKIVPATPVVSPTPLAPSFKLPALPWPFWALALALVLALSYWLGNRTAKEVNLEMERIQQQTTNTTAIAPRIDTVYLLDPDGTSIREMLLDTVISTKNTPSSPSRPGPEINTPETTGGATTAPPVTSPPAANPSLNLPAPSTPPSGAGAERRLGDIAPAVPRPAAGPAGPDMTFSTPKRPVNLNRARYTAPIKTLSPPSDQELWERRANQIVQSGDLIITPVRLPNGYFPAYRPRQ